MHNATYLSWIWERYPYFVFDDVPYEKGCVEAIGYIGGKEAARHSVSSYGAPAQIRIVLDHKYAPLRANNNDFIFVDADILDADGHHVYNYTDNVTFGVGYPNILFTYMICVACADTYNEKGISLIKKGSAKKLHHCHGPK